MTNPRVKAMKGLSNIAKQANRRQTVYTWAMVAVVVTLAGFDLWRWAWLVIGLVAMRAMLDLGMGVVTALSGILLQASLVGRE